MKVIVLSNCCARGFDLASEVIDILKSNGNAVSEAVYHQVHGRQLPIMTTLGLSGEDVRIAPYIVLTSESDVVIKWWRLNAPDYRSQAAEVKQ